MCVSVGEVVLVWVPSPKSQNEFVIVPVERSDNETLKGHSPVVGAAEKFAEAGTAAEPLKTFVALPALTLVKMALFVKLPTLVGAKRTTRFVAPKPGKLNGVP